MIDNISLLYQSRRPLVNFALIGVNLVVLVYTISLGALDEDIFIFRYGLIPVELSSGTKETIRILASGRIIEVTTPIPIWGTVFTSMFLHGGFLHIVGNMLFLYGFGDKVEYKLGHVKYLLFYLAAGVAAVWTQVATDLDSRSTLIGASGAISGVVGAYLIAYPYSRALALLFVFFILPLVFNFGTLGPGAPGAGIAYMAHVGGFIAGALLMIGYKMLLREPILPRRQWPPRFYEQ